MGAVSWLKREKEILQRMKEHFAQVQSSSFPKLRRIKQKYDVLQPYFSYRPDANPIIFLHGLGDSRKTWRLVSPIIVNKTGRKAYLIDARNHGEAIRSKNSDFDALTQDVIEFMDDHGIQRVLMVGHSMGGRTAINFALKYPERTEALVVEDMTPRNVTTGPNTLFRTLYELLMDNFRRIPADADLSTVKRNTMNFLFEFGKKAYLHSDSIPRQLGLDSESPNELSDSPSPNIVSDNEFPNDSKIYSLTDFDLIPLCKMGSKILPECDLEAMESMMERNFLVQDLAVRSVPFEGKALFLYGDSSFFNLAKDYSVKKLFPKATTKKIQNAMHLIHWQYPEEFAEAVSQFILLKDVNVSKY